MRKTGLGLLLLVCCVFMLGVAGCGGDTDSGTGTTEPASTTTVGPAPEAFTWTDLKPGGDIPSGRFSHSIVYAQAVGKVVLFGGARPLPLGDTWTYDPATNAWTSLDPAGSLPSARADHCMVYDSDRGEVILFGGWGTSSFNDTWAYDPTTNTWTDLDPSGSVPSPRSGHSMVYDSLRGKVLLFGGWDSTHIFNDTWAYDPATNTWTDLDPSGGVPSERYLHSMVYDSDSGEVILFGGLGVSTYDRTLDADVANVDDDTWVYDPATNAWTALEPSGSLPGMRADHCMVYDSGIGHAILFGGWDGDTTYDDTWIYDPGSNTWTGLEPVGSLPPARALGAAVFDPDADRLILFGGVSGDNIDLNDIWTFGTSP